MKKIFLLSIFIVGLSNVFSQTQITLTFLGKDSISQNSISLDSVYVKDIIRNCDTMLFGPSPVLVLPVSRLTGVNGTGAGGAEAFILNQNFPNPFQGLTSVTIDRAYSGDLDLKLFDGLGLKLAEYHNFLEKGSHSFRISSPGDKILYLVASDDKNHASIKMINTGQNNEASSIRLTGLAGSHEKSATVNSTTGGFLFYLGDQMVYKAYAGGYLDNTIHDSPTASTTYTFEMVHTSPVLPTVTTADISGITDTTATSGGNISSDGGAPVTARGVCWSKTTNPTTMDAHTFDGSGTGIFVSQITGLLPHTVYYVRGYAINSMGTAYGNLITFTTLYPQGPPLVVTYQVSDITQTSATCGGDVISSGGYPVTAVGVCWSTSPNPTTSDSHTIDGSGTGMFNSTLTGLTINTLYYVRAYAINSNGTGYGNEETFTTLNLMMPIVTTSLITNITHTTATGGGDVTSDGGVTVTARGVCWSTASNPTIANRLTVDGSGTGIFVSYLSGLTAGTQYHVRAYATNSMGTTYGNEMLFETIPIGIHYIGESFGGGIVFQINNPGSHGAIAATTDQSTGAPWGCSGTLIGGTSTGSGTGQANTTAIVNGCSDQGIAARICDNLVLNAYSDWFLPSKDELIQLYSQRAVVGGFSTTAGYWSSSEQDAYNAWFQDFSNGNSVAGPKTSLFYVRAIRTF